MAETTDNALAHLDALAQSFAQKLPQRAAEIARLWDLLLAMGYSDERIENLHRATHSLKGMGATFGFPRITEIATALDNTAKTFIEHKAIGTQQEQAGFQALLKLLIQTAANPKRERSGTDPMSEVRNALTPKVERRQWRLLGMVAPANDEYGRLRGYLRCHGYDVCEGSTFDALRVALAGALPSALLVDSTCCSKQQLEQYFSVEYVVREDVPLLLISATDSFADRLNAVRLGASGYVSSPNAHDAIAHQLDTQHSSTMNEPYRVLIVDDEVSLANHHAVFLRNAGMATEIVTDPETIFGALETFNPDVLLMDLYMPKCSGLELTSMIKLQEDYLTIPVVYLSAEADPSKQMATLERSGGEDFLTKPIKAETLVRAIKGRARRARRAESRAVMDRLTQVLNLHATEMMLRNEVSRACQVDAYISVALVDMDNFAEIEREHGEKNANRILRHFASVAREECPNVPIGRFGEKEFVMVFFAVDPQQAKSALSSVLTKFSQKRFQVPANAMFAAVASIGLASAKGCTDVEQICQHAAKCLFGAKDQGGGIIVASSLSES